MDRSKRRRRRAFAYRYTRTEVVQGMEMKKVADFDQIEQAAVYRAIRERRDVRRGYLPEPLPDDLLRRILQAAHDAPSVGLMQPWRFIIVRSLETRQEIHKIFLGANRQAYASYEGERQQLYFGDEAGRHSGGSSKPLHRMRFP